MHGSKLDHYEEQEKEWRASKDVRVDIKEEIKKSMKDLQCIPDVAGLSYEDLLSSQIWTFQKGSRFQSLTASEEWETLWLI